MVKLLHLSDIHMGSGFSHGHINPTTGLNTRLEDFIATLSRCIDRALSESVDLVLFGGDAFPDATPPPIVQQAFAQQFQRLVEAHIPTVLLVGNHDQHAQGMGGASLCIYRTLGVPDIIVGDSLATHCIETPSGPVQVITLPWLTHSTLLTRPETEGLSLSTVSELMLERLRVALEAEVRRLDPGIPSILLAHLMTDTARYGAEKYLAVGKGFTVPMALLARPCFDYVALGHVHKHQILCQQPPVVYPGSIERVDFSEEKETKGFVLANVKPGAAVVEFCPLPVRSFKTVEIDLSTADNPQGCLEKALTKAKIDDAIVRLIYKLTPGQVEHIDQAALHQCLSSAHSYTIHPELVSQLSRPRLPELTSDQTRDPISALQTYLANRNDLAELSDEMLTAAQTLLAEHDHPADALEMTPHDSAIVDDENQQLRLL
ncbi:exonuclease subunit SbcD [Leptothoe kymatousa]|uniref:Nuclease SbcCD subunit D n=1 Tax=Leptothoe kymatousa TAU-MAC 1615 TaxID=2364775 RepID=A0ABS5Y8L5_9CYAN|nr:exonuclease subunit SbcD [Leptothoe kymatousa]MBT9313709.1 exonuclease subunit SbcD [Leptothoe kymatousa TAU-MAC 1615]